MIDHFSGVLVLNKFILLTVSLLCFSCNLSPSIEPEVLQFDDENIEYQQSITLKDTVKIPLRINYSGNFEDLEFNTNCGWIDGDSLLLFTPDTTKLTNKQNIQATVVSPSGLTDTLLADIAINYLFLTCDESQIPKVLFAGDTTTIPISFKYSGMKSAVIMSTKQGKIKDDSLLVIVPEEEMQNLRVTLKSPETLEDSIEFPVNTFSTKTINEGASWKYSYCKSYQSTISSEHTCDSTYLDITVDDIINSDTPTVIFNVKSKVISYSDHSMIPDTAYETESTSEIKLSSLHINIWDKYFWSSKTNILPLLLRINIVQPCSYLFPDSNAISIEDQPKKVEINKTTQLSTEFWKYTYIYRWYDGGIKREIIPGIGLVYWSNSNSGGDSNRSTTWRLLSHNGKAIASN